VSKSDIRPAGNYELAPDPFRTTKKGNQLALGTEEPISKLIRSQLALGIERKRNDCALSIQNAPRHAHRGSSHNNFVCRVAKLPPDCAAVTSCQLTIQGEDCRRMPSCMKKPAKMKMFLPTQEKQKVRRQPRHNKNRDRQPPPASQ